MNTIDIQDLLRQELVETAKQPLKESTITSLPERFKQVMNTLLQDKFSKARITSIIGKPDEEKQRIAMLVTKNEIKLVLSSSYKKSSFKFIIQSYELFFNNNKVDNSFLNQLIRHIQSLANNLTNDKGDVEFM
ncbi:hypothetical protein DID76_04200 [Candidatus Marinamargulisbacteria bacterium SCGC AG-414-C22]|nr:hypothetical protein DID76_04200 [Candidatus Marinamargulisbacteria bacterium SCGC AG-414-C22]